MGDIFDIMIICYQDCFPAACFSVDRGLTKESLENPSHSLWAVRNDQDLPGEEGEHHWND